MSLLTAVRQCIRKPHTSAHRLLLNSDALVQFVSTSPPTGLNLPSRLSFYQSWITVTLCSLAVHNRLPLGQTAEGAKLLARLVLKARKRNHVQPLPRTFHWLPICPRIEYKISSLCYNPLTGSSADCLSELLTAYTPSRQLCSSADARTLRVPSTKTRSFGHISFSFTGPTQRNSLPYDVHRFQPVSSFKSALKTYLFKSDDN